MCVCAGVIAFVLVFADYAITRIQEGNNETERLHIRIYRSEIRWYMLAFIYASYNMHISA